MNHPIAKTILLLFCVIGLIACSDVGVPADESSAGSSSAESSDQAAAPASTAGEAKTVDTNHNLKETGIASITDDFPRTVRRNFDRYTQVIVPNGKPINIYAQAEISDAQIVQVRNTLIFWLTDVPGSRYGTDKTAVANKMGDNEATLMLLKGSVGDVNPPRLNAQPLYQNCLLYTSPSPRDS